MPAVARIVKTGSPERAKGSTSSGPGDTKARVSTDLLERAARWLQHDPDPTTRAELAKVLASAGQGQTGALADLADRFWAALEFGTAGLRGVIGAGETA